VRNVQEERRPHLRRGGILKSLEFKKNETIFLKGCVPVSVPMLRCVRKLHEEMLVDVALFQEMQHQAGFITTVSIGTF